MTNKTPNHAFWSDKCVLVTGHTGFKGGWLVQWLSMMGADVHGLALEPAGDINLFSLNGLQQLCSHNLVDLRSFDSVKRTVSQIRPDIVFHMGSQALVRPSIADPRSTYDTNVMGTVNLLEALRGQTNLQAVLCITSDKVYLNTNHGLAFAEDAPLGGKDPYSASKSAQEIIIQSYRQSFFEGDGVRLATARGGNVIGGGDFSVDRIIPDVVRSLESGTPLVLRHPEATRPWQHVLDCLNGYLLFAEYLAATKTPISTMNIGPDSDQGFATVQTLVEELFKAMQREPNWVHEPTEGSLEATMLSLDNAVAKHTIGWQDQLTGDAMIAATVEWYKSYFNGDDLKAVTQTQIQNFCE